MSGRGYWDRHAANYDRSMWLLGGPVEAMRRRAADAVRGCGRVLEVAAGTGLLTRGLAGSCTHLYATDYAAKMVEQMKLQFPHRLKRGRRLQST